MKIMYYQINLLKNQKNPFDPKGGKLFFENPPLDFLGVILNFLVTLEGQTLHFCGQNTYDPPLLFWVPVYITTLRVKKLRPPTFETTRRKNNASLKKCYL